ncbi:hypothetical protein GCM10010182_40730 [Actinomadura cremea]|nr:hypothetical protein GCM10010182_40730 [Actinomadura cremea]
MESEVFESPVLRYRNRRRRFRITDDSGRMLAEAMPVHGGEGAGAFARQFSEKYDTSAFSVRVARPDGEVLFFLERSEGEPIIFVTDPGHRMIGRITGTRDLVDGRRFRPRDAFVDIHEEHLGTIVWEEQRWSTQTDAVKRHCDFVSADGRHIGRFERGILRLDHRFSGPLHTLIVASPIIFHIRSGG